MSTDVNTQDKYDRAEIVKKVLINVMSSLKEMANVLPEKPDDQFNSAFKSLNSQKCIISICGEASRGKSYFINALIGKDILPVNEHSTTSQACKVTYSKNESYALVFEDDTRVQIDASEVKKYCSALESTVGDERINGKPLKYIEVNTPGKYLIPGVTFYDTPGLGSLHMSHEDVTFRCLSESDAVLFFCSIDRPFTKDELDFLTMVYKRTDNVLFIQSRSDLDNKKTLDNMASRNKEILSESTALNELIQKRYGRKIDFKFYPLSSKFLLDSASESSEVVSKLLYDHSHFDDIKRVIEELVFRTVVYSASLIAYNSVCSYHSGVVSILKNENEQLSKKSFEERKTYEDDVIKRKEKFDKEFGENSERQVQLQEEFESTFTDIRKQANEFFGEGGILYNDIISQLDFIPEDLSEAKDFAEDIASQISRAANDEWYDLVQYAQDAVYKICSAFHLEMEEDSFQNKRSKDSLAVPIKIKDGATIHSITSALRIEKEIARAKMRNRIIDFLQTGASSAGMYFKEISGGKSIIIAGAVNLFLNMFRAPAQKTSASEVNFAKIEARFRNEVITSINDISRKFVGRNGDQGEIGRLLDMFKKDAIRLIKKDVKSRKDRFDDESERLRNNLNLSEKQSADKINDNNNLLQELGGIQQQIENCCNELNDLKSFYDSI